MTRFTGICSFPHGGFISAGALLASCAAFVCTAFSMASCRFFVLTFISKTGNFEESFSSLNRRETGAAIQYKVGVGLFQWLRPSVPEIWDQGLCVGYQQTMRDEISDDYFEIARASGSMAVLLAVVVVMWSLFSACVAWNIWQIIILSLLLLGGVIACGLCFIFFRSDLCNSIFADSSCQMDEGGLVLVAGAILWLAAFMITVIFMRTLDNRMNDYALSELERSRAREMSMIAEKRAREKERRERQRAEDQARQLSQVPTISFEEEDGGVAALPVVTPSTVQSKSSFKRNSQNMETRADLDECEEDILYDAEVDEEIYVKDDHKEDEYEVYISGRVEKVDAILKNVRDSDDLDDNKRQPSEI